MFDICSKVQSSAKMSAKVTFELSLLLVYAGTKVITLTANVGL